MPIDKKRPLRGIIYEQLVDDILSGRINAGEKLLESDLADKFNVSRTPIREALLQLEKEGYTEHVKNVGATVKKISAQTVKEIFEVIAVLEGEATGLAVTAGISEQDMDQLRQLQVEMVRAAEERDYIAYNKLNIRFHHFFLKRCGNKTLSGIARDMRNRMYRLVSEGLSFPTKLSIQDHHNEGEHRPDPGSLCGSGDSGKNGTEHAYNQHHGRHHGPQDHTPDLPAGDSTALFQGNGWSQFRIQTAFDQDVSDIKA